MASPRRCRRHCFRIRPPRRRVRHVVPQRAKDRDVNACGQCDGVQVSWFPVPLIMIKTVFNALWCSCQLQHTACMAFAAVQAQYMQKRISCLLLSGISCRAFEASNSVGS